ncbi:MAG: hypothetical protein KAT71_08510, partial [Gammaproteobacteria bacterium]|nr:hypothetical protein [Gammaproteobacteria bacterium]
NGAILSFGDIARKLEDIKANTGKNYNLYSGWSYASQIELLRAMCDQNLLFATQYESFAYKLAEALKKNTTLEELILHNCQLDSKSFHCLANALKTNTSIKKLDISKNDCFTGPVYRCIEWDEPSGGEFSYCTSHSIDAREDKFFLLTSLIKSCHLESLTLSEKSIETYYKATTASRYKQLEEALKTNSSLIGLNLLGYKDIPIQPKRQYSHYIAPAEAFLLKANEFLVRNKRNKADAAAPRSTRNFF